MVPLTQRVDAMQNHVVDLLNEHKLRVIHLQHIDGNVAFPNRRIVALGPVVCEVSYAAALHEIGHCVAKGGLSPERTGKDAHPQEVLTKMSEEVVAWTWAKKEALEWTPSMEHLQRVTMSTYEHSLVSSRKALVRKMTKSESVKGFARRIGL